MSNNPFAPVAGPPDAAVWVGWLILITLIVIAVVWAQTMSKSPADRFHPGYLGQAWFMRYSLQPGTCASGCGGCGPRTCPTSNNYWTDALFNYNNFENFSTGPAPKVLYPYACTDEPGGPPFISNWDPSLLPVENAGWSQAAANQAAAMALAAPGPYGLDAAEAVHLN